MTAPAIRIAMLFQVETAYTRRLAAGASRFGRPDKGLITREFILGEELAGLPEAFEAWQPDAAVCFLSAEERELLAKIGASSRPVVNMSRGTPPPGQGVVLAQAEGQLDTIVSHFHDMGRRHIEQFIIGDAALIKVYQELHRRFAKDRHVPLHYFSVASDPGHLYHPEQLDTVDPSTAEWLRGLPKPASLFSMHTFVGPYLCRACRLLGLDVPKDVAIIGTDGFDVALKSEPPLTTVHLPAEEIGYAAAKLAAEMLAGRRAPRQAVTVPGAKIIVRESTQHKRSGGCDIGAALAFIEDYACEGINVQDVVSHTQGVTRMTFYTRFIEATGVKPAEVIKKRKLTEARRLLAETQFSISAIAGMCGYSDSLYFSQVFRRAEGIAPRGFRKIQFRKWKGL